MFTFYIWCTVPYGDSLKLKFHAALLFPPGSKIQFSVSDILQQQTFWASWICIFQGSSFSVSWGFNYYFLECWINWSHHHYSKKVTVATICHSITLPLNLEWYQTLWKRSADTNSKFLGNNKKAELIVWNEIYAQWLCWMNGIKLPASQFPANLLLHSLFQGIDSLILFIGSPQFSPFSSKISCMDTCGSLGFP